MNWFYAHNNQQAGPVDDAELARLVHTGVVVGTTLVWHNGLANWQPYDAVRLAAIASGTATSTFTAGPGQAVCSQCGRVFPDDEVVRVGAYDVCAECKPTLIQKLRQGVVTGGGYAGAQPYAEFGIRLGAAVLDAVIVLPFIVLVYAAYFFLIGVRANDLSHPRDSMAMMALQSISIVFTLAMSVLQGAYSAFCVSRYGATPGKRICELRVVRGNGEPLTFWRAFGRYSAKALPRAIPILGLVYMALDYGFIFSDAERRALHDQICDTRVIHHRKSVVMKAPAEPWTANY